MLTKNKDAVKTRIFPSFVLLVCAGLIYYFENRKGFLHYLYSDSIGVFTHIILVLSFAFVVIIGLLMIALSGKFLKGISPLLPLVMISCPALILIRNETIMSLLYYVLLLLFLKCSIKKVLKTVGINKKSFFLFSSLNLQNVRASCIKADKVIVLCVLWPAYIVFLTMLILLIPKLIACYCMTCWRFGWNIAVLKEPFISFFIKFFG